MVGSAQLLLSKKMAVLVSWSCVVVQSGVGTGDMIAVTQVWQRKTTQVRRRCYCRGQSNKLSSCCSS